MVDGIRPPSGDRNKNDSQPKPEKPTEGEDPQNQVDSLVSNNIGGIATKKAGEPGRIKAAAHKFLSRGLDLWPSTKKQKIIGSLIVVVLVFGGIATIYALKNLFKIPDPVSPVVQKIDRTHEPSRLTGVEIPTKLNKRPVTAIMIENSPDARPQSGLNKAGIVFEAVAEGGITRFCALYLEGKPGYIGPVRSVRPYYIDLFSPFDAVIVHAGGSAQGLAKIRKQKLKDLDHGPNAEAFQRIPQRYAPHNLYTSMKALDKARKKRGYLKSKFVSWERKEEDPAKKAKAKKINFALSGPLYDPQFNYDPKTNSYKRRMDGKPHIDEKSGKRLKPKVVIALVMDYSHQGIYSVYQTKGKGKMFVFQDGRVEKGTWKKKKSRGQFKFLNKSGQPLELNPGQTWVTLVPSKDAVKYSR